MTSHLSRMANGKLLIISLLFISLVTNDAFAQKFSLGVRGGPSLTWSVLGDKDDKKQYDYDSKFGYHVGGFISFPLKEGKYDCVIEGGFSQRGRKMYFTEGTGKNDATYYFTDASLLLRRDFKFNLGKNIPADWYINVGPHISYWLSGKGTIGSSTNDGFNYDVVFSKNVDLGEFDKMYLYDVNRWLFGANIGVGMHAPITSLQRVSLELRFMWGHTYYGARKSSSYSWVGFDDNMKANEKILTFTAAYTFDFDIKEGRKGKSTKDKEVKRKPVKRRRR